MVPSGPVTTNATQTTCFDATIVNSRQAGSAQRVALFWGLALVTALAPNSELWCQRLTMADPHRVPPTDAAQLAANAMHVNGAHPAVGSACGRASRLSRTARQKRLLHCASKHISSPSHSWRRLTRLFAFTAVPRLFFSLLREPHSHYRQGRRAPLCQRAGNGKGREWARVGKGVRPLQGRVRAAQG